MMGNNQNFKMTRRYPELRNKQILRDSKIAIQIIKAWDIEKDEDKLLKLFLSKKDKLSDFRYWEILRSVWIICGGIKNVDVFKKLLTSNRKHKHYFSTPEEHERLRKLPSKIQVYRACNSVDDGGISYTLSKEYAEWFKASFKKKEVVTRYVSRERIFALIERNAEEEILIL